MISAGPSGRTGRWFTGSSVFWIADVIITGDIVLALPAFDLPGNRYLVGTMTGDSALSSLDEPREDSVKYREGRVLSCTLAGQGDRLGIGGHFPLTMTIPRQQTPPADPGEHITARIAPWGLHRVPVQGTTYQREAMA